MEQANINNSILIQGVTPGELELMISRLLDKKLSNLTSTQPTNKQTTTGLYRRRETAAQLKISLVTLDAWTKAGLIHARHIGTLKYYTDKDIQEALTKVNQQ